MYIIEMLKAEIRNPKLDYDDEAYNCGIKTAINIVNAKLPHWIPCSTRLPFKRECEEQGTNLFLCTVLVNNDYKILEMVLLNTDYKTWHSRAQREVIAWRPLPQPYKEESK